MSRKSLPKKDSISWFLCSKCDSFISAKDRDRHVDLCAPNASIEASKTATIKNKQFFSSELHVKPVTEDLNGINEQQLKRFILLHESVINLCEFVLGDFLLISSSALPNAAPIVRCVWPLLNSNSSPTSVYVCESGKYLSNRIDKKHRKNTHFSYRHSICLLNRIEFNVEASQGRRNFNPKIDTKFDSRIIDNIVSLQQRR